MKLIIAAAGKEPVGSVVVAVAGHRPVGIAEQKTVDKGNTADTAVGIDPIQGIAGNIVDNVAADTIDLLLAAHPLGLKLGFEMPGWVAVAGLAKCMVFRCRRSCRFVVVQYCLSIMFVFA